MKFKVVIFESEEGEDVEAVPETWLNDGDKHCYWPSHLKLIPGAITTAVNRGVNPEDEWDNFAVKQCYGPYGTPLEARQKAKRIVDPNRSDTTTDSEAVRKRKPTMRLKEHMANNASKRKKIHATLAAASPPTKIAPKFPSPPPERRRASPNISPTPTRIHVSPQITASPTLQGSASAGSNFEKLVLAGLSVIKIRMKNIEDSHALILDQLKELQGNSGNRRRRGSLKLPLESLEQLNEMEEVISNNVEIYEELANALDWLGGADPRKGTFKVMQKLMTNSVAQHLNWKGGKNKKPFETYELCDIVINSVHFFFGKKKANKKIIQDAIKDWLKAAPTRLKSSRKEMSEDNNPGDEDQENVHSPSSSDAE